MKKIILIQTLVLLLCATRAQAQLFKKLKQKVDKKVAQTEKKMEQKIEKGVDDLLFGSDSTAVSTPDSTMNMPQEQQDMFPDASGNSQQGYEEPTSFKAYSAYDFTSGRDILAFEDFSTVALGDFPANWNSNAGAQVVEIDGKDGRWLKLGQKKTTLVMNEMVAQWHDDFTLEFDIIYDFPIADFAYGRHVDIIMSDLQNPQGYLSDAYKAKAITYLRIGAGSNSGRGAFISKTTSDKALNAKASMPHPAFASKTGKSGDINHIAIVKKGQRLKMYINSDKVIDMIQAFDPNASYRSLRFASEITPANQHFYISNIKYATAVDIPTSLFENGSYQAHGITFKTNAASIEPYSYATIKELATEMQNSSKNYSIIGHTDHVGTKTENLTLSQQRANTVKEVLVSEFNINPNRLSTTGVGASQPLSSDTDASAMAQNRRVEIKEIF